MDRVCALIEGKKIIPFVREIATAHRIVFKNNFILSLGIENDHKEICPAKLLDDELVKQLYFE